MDMVKELRNGKERPILIGSPDDLEGMPDNAAPSESFSNLQAQLSPSSVYCCSPRTSTWYRVSVANLTPVTWQKGALDAFVMDPDTKNTLRRLVEEHKRGRLDGALSDFIENKGQVCLYGSKLLRSRLTCRPLSLFFMVLPEWERL